MKHTVVFVVSHNYSGSTWLSLMLGSHSAALSVGELNKCYSRKHPRGCTLCAQAGRECPYFGDASRIAREDVFPTTFQRAGVRLIVDNSKRIKWCSHFLADPRFDRRFIHLVRDPRGVACSQRLRGRDVEIDQWAERNLKISRFLKTASLDHMVITYNELAEDVASSLARLCGWLEIDYEPSQPEYWNFLEKHHGPGANGATSAFLENVQASQTDFYAAHRRTNFVDLRWQDQLPADAVHSIESDPRVQQALNKLSLEFSSTGLIPHAQASLAQ
jgi:hypothetical protein